MYVNEYFALGSEYLAKLSKLKPDFDPFGEIVFYRTYSRIKRDGTQESWYDVVVRVTNGVMSIRKDWYKKNFIYWDEAYWQRYAYEMAVSMFKMYWLPPGRGLWAMGTQFIYERGSMALYNCSACKLGSNDSLSNDYHWMMDCLMLGVGVGFEAVRDDLKIYKPVGEYDHFVLDSREGWTNILKLTIDAYTKPNCRKPKPNYSLVRPRGSLIRGFGGQASGPDPLERLINQICQLFETPGIDIVRLKTDIANLIGVCVVAGNVRRSAELGMGHIDDPVFPDLKDYSIYPDREDWGWMSNNTVKLFKDSDYESLGEIAKRVVVRGEPGIANLRNFRFGRIGKPDLPWDDLADLLNPCGEITLIDKELCNVDETLPTRCPNVEAWYKACEYATFYASTVSLLPTHREETNRVILKNRRIGVGIIDWTGWIMRDGLHRVIKYMRNGYNIVRETNKRLAAEAGVPESVKVTTVKPGGSIPKLPGKTPGIGYPTYKHTLRRMRVASNNPVCGVLDGAGIPWEPCYFDPAGTRIYEYPTLQGPAEPADQISLWEQAMNLVTVQREWADNAVSNTLYFRPKWKLIRAETTLIRDWSIGEEAIKKERERQLTKDFAFAITGALTWDASLDEAREFVQRIQDRLNSLQPFEIMVEEQYKIVTKLNKYGEWELYIYEYDPNHEEGIIEKVLSAITPLIKSCSLLPHSAKGAYRQMPEEGISVEEYDRRKKAVKPIDWTKFRGSDGIDEKFCQGDTCVITKNGSTG